jgi:hypothetical protein
MKEHFWLKNKILVKILNFRKNIIFSIFGKFCIDDDVDHTMMRKDMFHNGSAMVEEGSTGI